MAMGKLLSQRLFNISKMSSQGLMNCRISSSSLAVRTRVPKDPGEASVDPEPDDLSVPRRFFQNIAVNLMDTTLKKPVGESLMDKLREMDVNKGRIRLDGLSPPTKPAAVEETVALGLTVQDAKKLLRAAQIEVVKTKLMETGKSWITYSEFVRLCSDSSLGPDHGTWIAKMLDDSGNVIVLGDSVCLRPDQVTKSIEGLLPLPQIRNPNDPRRKELKELEAIKKVIDQKAHSLVRRELQAGLGYMILQTALFMRLTFWELTWDVMEPVCFYVTSIYFMAGYSFFLRTWKEPSFEGFYQSRFEAKQRKLMETQDFDVGRYDELKKLFNPKPSSAAASKILGTIHN
ncbi:Calcium uniporter protein 1 [Raphanus sativus]|uniref:Calcium uniporter protein 1, mitochondrial n=1 Tax=Raphanus sativus TaxID=3726 RepID=A0A6J0NIR3_RAPSA|nr:calcium uniporter protein 1, mitochondrial [Raphanus sativus]XP_056863816.1 calcium uniporter protein 1, mitochondrial [Raphanus sativus]KAJ4870941.1 Calcium uniporter protein 1 [Raphanus sativus]KAJ4898817.1 Calcium uniporter protein 1 [Raphanus sativus]